MGSFEKFLVKREKLVFDAFGDSEPVERARDGSDMTGLRILLVYIYLVANCHRVNVQTDNINFLIFAVLVV